MFGGSIQRRPVNKLIRCSPVDDGVPHHGHNGIVMSADTETSMRARLREMAAS
jgi:hypothetical protein